MRGPGRRHRTAAWPPADPALPTVLVNHYPLVREPTADPALPGVRAVVRHRAHRRLAPALPTPPSSSTATCTSRAPPGTTACASRRCRWATRASGGAAATAPGSLRHILPERREPAADRARSCRRGGERRGLRRPAGASSLFPEEEAVDRPGRGQAAARVHHRRATAPAGRWPRSGSRRHRSCPASAAPRVARRASSGPSPTATATGPRPSPATRSPSWASTPSRTRRCPTASWTRSPCRGGAACWPTRRARRRECTGTGCCSAPRRPSTRRGSR